jgi:hypothetical protein
MAGRLIVMKNDATQINGDVEAAGYEKWIELGSLTFAAAGFPDYDSKEFTGSANQSSMQVTVKYGTCIAELQQRLYHGQELGKVEIHELRHKVSTSGKTWEKIREMTLQNAYVEALTHGWGGISTTVTMSIGYTDMTYSSGAGTDAKHAHFESSEKTAK